MPAATTTHERKNRAGKNIQSADYIFQTTMFRITDEHASRAQSVLQNTLQVTEPIGVLAIHHTVRYDMQTLTPSHIRYTAQ